MTATEHSVGKYQAIKPGRLDALIVHKGGGRSCHAHEILAGDTLEVVDVLDWPKPGVTTNKILIIRDNRVIGEAKYNGARLRDLTR